MEHIRSNKPYNATQRQKVKHSRFDRAFLLQKGENMGEDNYSVVKYKILVYLYACVKRKILFDRDSFNTAIKRKDLSEEYLAEILRMMSEEGLIEGVTTTRAWGNVSILTSEPEEIRITGKGIEYISENSTMQKVRESLVQAVDIVADLLRIAGI